MKNPNRMDVIIYTQGLAECNFRIENENKLVIKQSGEIESRIVRSVTSE